MSLNRARRRHFKSGSGLEGNRCIRQYRNQNLKSDKNVSKKELCQTIKKQLPNFIYIDEQIGKDPDQRNYIVSNKKIEATGFKTEFSLKRGIGELIKGYSMIKNSKYGNV